MKYGKLIKWFALVFVVATVVCSTAARRDQITLVMVPRDDATVQLGSDFANKYPVLLVSYKLGANGAVSLHGWTGTQWVNVTVEDFRAGNFFRTGPDSALIIETAGAPVPAQLIPPADWCMSVSKITTAEMRPLIHLAGQYFDFPFKDWQWFAKRYSMDMDSINPDGLNVAWYNKRLSEHFKQRGSSPVGASDLQYWVSVRLPVVPEPVVKELAPIMEEMEPASEEEIRNPLTSNMPPAVVLGPSDAPEEVPAEPGAAKAQAEAAAGKGGL